VGLLEGDAMKKAASKLYWKIRGHDSLKTIFEANVEFGHITENQICHLLQALASKAGLTFAEMVGAYAKRRSRISNDLLTVHKDLLYSTWMCGSGPVFTASVVDANGNIASPALDRPRPER